MSVENGRSLYELLAAWQGAIAADSWPQPPAYDGPDVLIRDLVEHTNDVRPGSCFVARVRAGSDGHPYIPQAIERGAALIIGQHDPAGLGFPLTVPYLQVEDSGLVYAWLAAAWEDFPGRDLVMIGVTGTNGKTTTANILHEILRAAGIKTGLLSTLRAVIGETEEPLALHVTTPEAPAVQRYLRRMRDAGLTHCVLETTSHSLAQHRVAGIDFDVAVVTNVTHEHLDYHGSFAEYLAAKAQLFEALTALEWSRPAHSPLKTQTAKLAVLNADDSSLERLAAVPAPRQLLYGLQETADAFASDVDYSATMTTYTLHLPGRDPLPISASLPGDFNLYNMLAAAATAHGLGIELPAIRQGLEQVRGLTGRMEQVDEGQDFLVVVDFAHTPDGLEKAIAAGRRMAPGRIITVFGSAGKRDVEKRRLMAEISARDADLTVLTAEDPRTEPLEAILAMMAAGCESQGAVEGESFWRVPDRGRAIYKGLELARPGDLVLICGKGHEQSMCFITTEYPWDDIKATRTALRAFLAGEPMPNLGLPTF